MVTVTRRSRKGRSFRTFLEVALFLKNRTIQKQKSNIILFPSITISPVLTMSNSLVTPFALGLCALIALISDINSPLEANREGLVRFLQLSIQNRTDPNTLQSLAHRIHQVDPECAKVWMQVLTASSESIDSFLDLSSSLQRALEDAVVDSASQAGILVRATCLALDEMLFDRLGVLWTHYRDEIAALNRGGAENHSTNQSTPSTESLRSACLDLDQAGRPTSIEDVSISDSPEAHFLTFLKCLSEGERVGALHSLHQFVDTAMIAERKKEHESNKKRSNVLGHAAVLLASVHAKFGEGSLHQLATEEALRVAQQSGDAASIAFAMGLLYESSSGGPAQDVLQQCSSRATGAKAYSLATSANLALGKELLAKGEIQNAWREWMLSTHEKPADSTSVWTDRPAKLTANTNRLQSQQLMVGLEMWESLGFYGMASLLAKIGLQREGIGPMERTQFISKAIQSSMHGPEALSSKTSCRYQSALDMITALGPNHEHFLKALVMHEWAVRIGNLQDARVLLGFLQSYVNPRMANYLQARIQVGSQHTLLLSRQGQFDNAKMVLKALLEICKNENLPMERVTILLQLATSELDASPQVFTGAMKPLLECLELTEKLSIDSLNATTLSLLAQIQLRLNKPRKALPMLKAAMPSLRQHGHVWHVAEAHLTVAKCHLVLAKEEARREASHKTAIQSLERASNFFSECQDFQRLKEIYYLQARVYDLLPGEVAKRDEASKRFMDLTNCVSALNKPSNSRTINDIFTSNFNIPVGKSGISAR
jgi:tetratricopeptide (TPR) repeat protein